MSSGCDVPDGPFAAQSGESLSPVSGPQALTEQNRALFNASVDLLSRREHSCHELRQKLAVRFPEASVEPVLLRLQELNYQSDTRFAEVFARSRIQRGQGPLRIRQELQLRGVSTSLVSECMEQLMRQVDWCELAFTQLQRKFRSSIDGNLPRELVYKERARRQRYLGYRGFPVDAINFALDQEY